MLSLLWQKRGEASDIQIGMHLLARVDEVQRRVRILRGVALFPTRCLLTDGILRSRTHVVDGHRDLQGTDVLHLHRHRFFDAKLLLLQVHDRTAPGSSMADEWRREVDAVVDAGRCADERLQDYVGEGDGIRSGREWSDGFEVLDG